MPAGDDATEAAQTRVRGDGHGGDDLQHRSAYPADDQRQAQRDLDLGQDLPLCHAVGPSGVDGLAVDGLQTRVRPGEHGRNGQDHEGDGGSDDGRPVVGHDVAEHHQQEEQHPEGRQRSHRPGERDDGLSPLAGVADVEAERQRDQSGDDDGHARVDQVLDQPVLDRQRALAARDPVRRIEDPGRARSAGGSSRSSGGRHVERGGRHAARRRRAARTPPPFSFHGISSRPMPTGSRDRRPARAAG